MQYRPWRLQLSSPNIPEKIEKYRGTTAHLPGAELTEEEILKALAGTNERVFAPGASYLHEGRTGRLLDGHCQWFG